MPLKTHFEFTFKPLDYLDEPFKSTLAARLKQADSPTYFRLNALQRRNRWVFELPTGTFVDDYDPMNVTMEAERAARDSLIQNVPSPRGFRQRDIVTRDGVDYYHRVILVALRDHATNPAMFRAMLAFMDAAERDRTLVKGKPTPRPFIPHAERVNVFGSCTRGPAWSAAEDDVLRRWFGRRTVGEHVGEHVLLTDIEWTAVLAELKGRRTKNSAQQRLSVLNAKLFRSMLEEQRALYGTTDRNYLRRALVPKYMTHVLGEKPRLPPMRPSR